MVSRKAETMLAPSSTRKVGGMEFCRCERDRDRTEVEQLLLALRVEVMPFDQHQLHWALEGWRRYGKGRPPAVQGRRLRGHRRAPRPWSRERSRGALRARKDAAHHRE